MGKKLKRGIAINDEKLRKMSGGGMAFVAAMDEGRRADEKAACVVGNGLDGLDGQNEAYRNNYNTEVK